MNHPAEWLLTHDLERCDVKNESYRGYVMVRATEVQDWIDTMRGFALLKPGRVADACNAAADSLQRRLDAALAR